MASTFTEHQIKLVINKLTKATLDELSTAGRLSSDLSDQLFLTTDDSGDESSNGAYSAQNPYSSLSATSSALSFEQIYPVGSIYLNVTDANPSHLFGIGVWQKISQTECSVPAAVNADKAPETLSCTVNFWQRLS